MTKHGLILSACAAVPCRPAEPLMNCSPANTLAIDLDQSAGGGLPEPSGTRRGDRMDLDHNSATKI